MSIFDYPHNNIITCQWLPINHFTFHIANLFLIALYVGDFINFPSTFHYMVFLRVVLSGASIFFCFWGFWILCASDTGAYNFLFFLYNCYQLFRVVYRQCFSKTLEPRFESLYNACYKKCGLTVDTYNSLIEGAGVMISDNEVFYKSHFGQQLVQIISGRVLLYLINGQKVKLRDGDFINYNHWNFSIMTTSTVISVQKYEVISETKLLYWSYDTLHELFKSKPPEQCIFSNRLLQDTNNLLVKILSLNNEDLRDINLHMDSLSDSNDSEVSEKNKLLDSSKDSAFVDSSPTPSTILCSNRVAEYRPLIGYNEAESIV